MPVWNENSKFRLLLAIIDSAAEVKLPPWDVVAKKMGSEYTGEAVRQQYAKIKKAASSELNQAGDAADTPAITPKSRKRGTTTPKAKKTSKYEASPSEDDEAEAGQLDDSFSPEKKVGTPAKRKTADSDESASPKKKTKATPARKSKTTAAAKKAMKTAEEEADGSAVDGEGEGEQADLDDFPEPPTGHTE